MKISIGIDIGSDGAYAIFIDNKLQYGKIPNVAKEPDMKQMLDIIFEAIATAEDQVNIHAVIEDLHSVFGSSAKSNFGFGVNNGLVIAMLQISQIAYTKVSPKKWQKVMWEGIRPIEIPTGKKDKKGNPKYKIDTKATSLIAAKRLFPKETFLASDRSTVPHNGIIDACLLAEFCRRHF